MAKIFMQTAQVQKLIDFFDGYEDDKVKCTFVDKKGIKATFDVETEMSDDDAAAYLKGLFKNTPDGKVLFFSIQPAGFFGKK